MNLAQELVRSGAIPGYWVSPSPPSRAGSRWIQGHVSGWALVSAGGALRSTMRTADLEANRLDEQSGHQPPVDGGRGHPDEWCDRVIVPDERADGQTAVMQPEHEMCG